MTLKIAPAKAADTDAMYAIFLQVVAGGDSYIYPENTTKKEFKEIWMAKPQLAYVAKMGKEVVAMYTIRPNKIGRGGHVCNAGFMVAPAHHGKGYGRSIGEHSLVEAKRLGYHAMQFNIVVSTNTRAVKLWYSLGFKDVGIVPKGYDHKEHGYVDIHIMHRFL